MPGLYIDAADIRKLHGCGDTRSYQIQRLLKDVYEKQKHQKITIGEYCRYFGVDEKEVIKKLSEKPGTQNSNY
jgi:hypothetical protein